MTTCWETSVYIFKGHIEPGTNKDFDCFFTFGFVILLPLNNPLSIIQFLLQLLHCFADPSNVVVERVKEYVHCLLHLYVHLILVKH